MVDRCTDQLVHALVRAPLLGLLGRGLVLVLKGIVMRSIRDVSRGEDFHFAAPLLAGLRFLAGDGAAVESGEAGMPSAFKRTGIPR